jgi:hypothetical protein
MEDACLAKLPSRRVVMSDEWQVRWHATARLWSVTPIRSRRPAASGCSLTPASGALAARSALDQVLDQLRPGDTLVV